MAFKMSPINQDRAIFVIYLVLIAAPFISAVGLPLRVSSLTRSFRDTIESVPDGGVVLWVTDCGFSTWIEIGSGDVAVYKRLFQLAKERGIKIVFATTYGADGAVLSDRSIREDIIKGGLAEGLKYGENWVQLGWLPGWESSLAALVRDIHEVAPTDYQGTPIGQLPMMENIRSVEDLDLLGWSGYYVDEYARQWTGFGKPTIVNLSATTVAMAKPWFEKGLITAYLNGQRGCAEYETLTGFRGFATSAMDAQSLAHLLAIFLLIIPNLYYLTTRFGKR